MTSRLGRLVGALALVSVSSDACTSFYMPKNIGYDIVARTMDYATPLFWHVKTYPATNLNEFGFVGIESGLVNFQNEKFVAGGLSTKGVTCDAQILVGARYQSIVAPFQANKTGIFAGSFCGWILSTFASVADATAALRSEQYLIWGPIDYEPLQLHFVVRDRSGDSVVVEYVNTVQSLYLDSLDHVESVPIVTNEPTYDFHLTNVALLRFKMAKERTALGIPANYYPDERLLRVFVTLLGIKTVNVLSYDEALAITMSVADRVHVPRGEQYGTDTGNMTGKFTSHTQYSCIYDLSNLRLYWRTDYNPSLQGVLLSTVDLSLGAPSVSIAMVNDQPLFNDVTKLLR